MKDTPLRPVREEDSCLCCDNHEPHKHSFFEQLMAAFRYAFIDLFEDVWKWLIAGMLIGGAISFFIPDDFIGSHIHYGFQGMILMLIIGLPMYVCATGSIPIAAALMMKGLNPGAAFVFLLVGPATNAVSMTVIGKSLGRKALIIYISSLVASSLVLGAFLDIIWQWFKVGEFKHLAFHGTFLPKGIEYVSTAIILILIVYILVSEFFKSRKETL